MLTFDIQTKKIKDLVLIFAESYKISPEEVTDLFVITTLILILFRRRQITSLVYLSKKKTKLLRRISQAHSVLLIRTLFSRQEKLNKEFQLGQKNQSHLRYQSYDLIDCFQKPRKDNSKLSSSKLSKLEEIGGSRGGSGTSSTSSGKQYSLPQRSSEPK